MIAARLNSKFRQWPGVSALAIMATLSSFAYAAPVPVVDSQPLDAPSVTEAAVSTVTDVQPVISAAPVTPSAQTAALADSSATGTAYLLNTMDQMRQEIMELRGQLEEQQFQLNQLSQESRDRYLDLDERITRQSNGSKPNTVKPVSPAVVPATATITAPSFQDSPAAIDQAAKALEQAEQKSYQAAFQLIRDKEFDQAQQALKKQLGVYPRGKYADNARYWLGEVQMAQGKYPDARDTFQLVRKDYPDSPKVPDATYKLGRLHDLLGDQAKARELLESVIKDYPDTAAARLSDTYLRSMPNS